jgi:hypothetical protein
LHINVIDPGMRTYAGHHCDINTRVARELISRGHSVTIYANQSFRPKQKDMDLRIEAIFAANPYSLRGIPKGIGRYFKNNKNFHASAQQFANELAHIEPAGALLFPTLFPYQLHGLCRSPKGTAAGFSCHAQCARMGQSVWRRTVAKGIRRQRAIRTRPAFGRFRK